MRAEVCDMCGTGLPPFSGRGRPRVRCERCAADKARVARLWRQRHPERVRRSNESRRVVPSIVFTDDGWISKPSSRPKSKVY
jgi:hypothetical protein